MIDFDPMRFLTWEHSSALRDLYRRRCRCKAPEMDAHAQAAELLAARLTPGDAVLDAGCGSGYFFHSLSRRGLDVRYWGIDAAPSLVAIGQQEMPTHGLPADRLRIGRIEDVVGAVDHAVCINVLTHCDNYHRPLERLLRVARKCVILRESFREDGACTYVEDKYLDAPEPLMVHINHYSKEEVAAFVRGFGFEPTFVVDRRTQGLPEMVIDHPHYWTFLVADRRADRA